MLVTDWLCEFRKPLLLAEGKTLSGSSPGERSSLGPWELEENPDEDPKLKLKDCWASAGDGVETTAMIPTEAMIPSERMLFIENFMFVFIVDST
jgi:hypothetical protein